jgi:hypothetical protein
LYICCFLYMMNHGIFGEPIFRLTRESASQIVQAFIGIQHTKFWTPIFSFFSKSERVRVFGKHGNLLCMDDKHDRSGSQFNSLVSEWCLKWGHGSPAGGLVKQNGW